MTPDRNIKGIEYRRYSILLILRPSNTPDSASAVKRRAAEAVAAEGGGSDTGRSS